MNEEKQEIDPATPQYIGFLHFSMNALWVKDNFTLDQTGVLYAVGKGVGLYWNRLEGGRYLP